MTPVEERIDHEQLRQLKEKYRDDGLERLARANPDYYNSHGSYLPELATLLLAERAEMRDLLTEHFAREEEIKRLRGWPEIKVGAQSPPHSPVDRYRCENENCEIESVWEFRPDDYDLDESVVNCPSCGEEGELFFRWFRGGAALPATESAQPEQDRDEEWIHSPERVAQPEEERVTHGRNCPCTPCKAEDWDEIDRNLHA